MPRVTYRSFAAIAAAGALGLSLPGVALASGGGGGGGGVSAPSARSTVDVAALYREGVQQYQAGEYSAAERTMRKVTREVRSNAQAQYMLGLSRMAQEKWRPASSALKKAVRYDAENHDARAQLGLAYLQQDKADKAAAQMAELDERLAACGEDCGPTLVAAADTLRTAMNPETATEEETAALYAPVPVTFTVDDGDAAYLDAVRLINIGHYDDALEKLGDAQAVFGPHPDVLTYIGFANRKAGNYTQAINYYSAALELQPDHVGANEYLGEYYVELGDMDAAYGQLAKLENICNFGCAETDELRSWIVKAEAKSS
ncbi:MAG: tetratricopeptide repeat protein [Hyphomonadaceae bacterium]